MTSIQIIAYPFPQRDSSSLASPSRSPKKAASSRSLSTLKTRDEWDGNAPLTPTITSNSNKTRLSSPSISKTNMSKSDTRRNGSFNNGFVVPNTPPQRRSSLKSGNSATLSKSPSSRRTPTQRRKSAPASGAGNDWMSIFSIPLWSPNNGTPNKKKSGLTRSLSSSNLYNNQTRRVDSKENGKISYFGRSHVNDGERISYQPNTSRSQTKKGDYQPKTRSPKHKKVVSTTMIHNIKKNDKKQSSRPKTSPSKQNTHEKVLDLTSLMQSLGEIRNNLSAPPAHSSLRRRDSTGPVPQSPVTTPETKKNNPATTMTSPKPGKIQVVAYTPAKMDTPTKKQKSQVASPQKTDASSKHKTTTVTTKGATNTAETNTTSSTRAQRRPMFPKAPLPLDTTTTTKPQGILKKRPKYPVGPVTRRDGKIFRDHWSSEGQSVYLGNADNNNKKKKKKKNASKKNNKKQVSNNSETSHWNIESNSCPRSDDEKSKPNESCLPVQTWSAKNKSSSPMRIPEEEKDESDLFADTIDIYAFDVNQYLSMLDDIFQVEGEDPASRESANQEVATDDEEYPVINIAPLENDDHSSVTAMTSESSYEEIELIEEEEVIEEYEEEMTMDEEIFDDDDDSSAAANDGRCNACGLETSCIPEGLVSCLRCKKAHYCSVDCLRWDYTSGDHASYCVEVKQ